MPFDVDDIVRRGWRQGAILGPALSRHAREVAPSWVARADSDWLIVTSHDCDVANPKLEKEPFVEVLRAQVLVQVDPDPFQGGGRNPREIQVKADDGATAAVLCCSVHERWTISRELLATEAPARFLSDKTRRVLAEWLAKRYIRAAFPSSFDCRWHHKVSAWTKLLAKHSASIQGVYLRLDTLKELEPGVAYQCALIIAVTERATKLGDWAVKRKGIEQDILSFWQQFGPSIKCVEVEVLGTDELTLADIAVYQRFDADWVSYSDESEVVPLATDMAT